MKLLIFSILFLANLVFVPVSLADSSYSEYSEARIYFLGWNVSSEKVFSLDWTRRHYKTLFDIKDVDYIKQFMNLMRVEDLKPNSPSQVHDVLPWLVVDLYQQGQLAKTYYSDGCDLYSEEGKYSHPVTESFRSKFLLSDQIQPKSDLAVRLTKSEC